MGGRTLENKHERIRGPNLDLLIKHSSMAPFEEGMRKADEQNLVIASSLRLSQELRIIGYTGFEDMCGCWAGTMTGYEKPGKGFGKTIEYVDDETGCRWVFPVPEQFRGEKNAMLVAEHPDYVLETDGINRVVHAAKVDLVKRFPIRANSPLNEWFLADPRHDIPQGDPLQMHNENTRQLSRIEKRVGPVKRIEDGDGHGWRTVLLDTNPSHCGAMIVEAPDPDERMTPPLLDVTESFADMVRQAAKKLREEAKSGRK